MSLHFNALRGANRARLPQFKDAKGRKAHKHADGHDWTPAQWLQAAIGELGELCAVRAAFEAGVMPYDAFRIAVAKELADVQIQLDLVAQRILDPVIPMSAGHDPAPALMELIAVIGSAANERKKFDRGDYSPARYFEALAKLPTLAPLLDNFLAGLGVERGTKQVVVAPDSDGVDLGAAVVDKFNEVSERVGSTVRLT